MPRGKIELMADAVLVVLLLVFIWAAVLVPPAAGARASREAEFLGSLRPRSHPLDGGAAPDRGEYEAGDGSRFRPALTANARRRQVLGGLVVAIGATLLLGLLPTFRLLLVVHLLLLNSCLAYIGLLVRVRDERTARTGATTARTRWHDSEVAEVEALAALADEPAYASARGQRYERLSELSYDADDDFAWEAEDAYVDPDFPESYDDDEYSLDEVAEAAYVDDELGLARPA
ncbi:MAG TPA: hypothetical protein VF244_06830 [Acidimicrobiales bacterium]